MQRFGQIAVRVDEAKAQAVVRVLSRHVAEQGRLAGAGLADDVQVRQAVGQRDAERAVAVAVVCEADRGDGVVVRFHRPSMARIGRQARRADVPGANRHIPCVI